MKPGFCEKPGFFMRVPRGIVRRTGMRHYSPLQPQRQMLLAALLARGAQPPNEPLRHLDQVLGRVVGDPPAPSGLDLMDKRR